MPSSSAPSARAGQSGTDTIRRSPASPSGSSSPGTINAAHLAATLAGGTGSSRTNGSSSASSFSSGSSSSGTIRRSPERGSSPSSDPASGSTVRRTITDTGVDGDIGQQGSGSPFGSEREEREWFERMVANSIEEIVRRVEDRVIIDLERRGGRNWRNL
jgi:hypothetical protein